MASEQEKRQPGLGYYSLKTISYGYGEDSVSMAIVFFHLSPVDV